VSIIYPGPFRVVASDNAPLLWVVEYVAPGPGTIYLIIGYLPTRHHADLAADFLNREFAQRRAAS
jgi:hypothetical protein